MLIRLSCRLPDTRLPDTPAGDRNLHCWRACRAGSHLVAAGHHQHVAARVPQVIAGTPRVLKYQGQATAARMEEGPRVLERRNL